MQTSTLTTDMHRGPRTGKWLALLTRTGLGIMLALLLSSPGTASADDLAEPPPSAPLSNAVGSCLLADQVWLFVVDVDGEVLANQCVGTPASGEEALARGGMQIRFSSGRLICSLSGHPEQCPATFTGSYWNYHHGRAGSPYTFAKQGANSRRPTAGDIEAWCYNAPGEEKCTPPLLSIVEDGTQVLVQGAEPTGYVDPQPTRNEAVPVPSSTPWALIGTGGVIVAGILGMLWWRRRTGPNDDQVGGR